MKSITAEAHNVESDITPVPLSAFNKPAGPLEASDQSASGQPLVRIRPPASWASFNLTELWPYRDLLFGLAIRDIKLRYRQTALGVIWVLLQPLIGAAIFAFVFGTIAGIGRPPGVSYFLFAYTGMLAWNTFSGTFTKASNCLVGNVNLVSKIYFPRLILPLSVIPSVLLDFAVGSVVLTVLLVESRAPIGWNVLTIPVWLLTLTAFALGLGLIGAALTVSYRDVQHILPIVTQFMLYASPVAYTASNVPQKHRWVVSLNPMSGMLDGFRWSVLGQQIPPLGALAYSLVTATIALLIGLISFKSMERRFADVI